MNERIKRRTSGWAVDALIIGLAALVLLAFILPRPAKAVEVPVPDASLGCYTYANNTAAYIANGQKWAPLNKGQLVLAAGLAEVDPSTVTRGFVVLTGHWSKPWAIGLEVSGCLLPKPVWVDSLDGITAKTIS